MDSFSYALLAALCWGVAPVFGKLGLANISATAGLIARTFLAGGLVAPWVIYRGGLVYLAAIPFRAWGLLAMEALLMTVAGDLAYFMALKRGQPAEVNLLVALAPFITLLVSAPLFGEEVTRSKLLGGFLICAGAAVVGLGAR